MNGYPARANPYGYDAGSPSPSISPTPGGRRLVEGYRKDIMGGFERDKPRFNPMNSDRMQSSALVDLKDPIQVHLLTETALLDSKKYEILSQEEVDDLKKQCHTLSQRIEQARSNLTIQSKYRDAAASMAKLYVPGKQEGKRRSLLGSRSSGDNVAEAEKQACERRCEQLASELWDLERRCMEPQRRLLEHTAGILQLTHKASSKKAPPAMNGLPLNGIPGSPESLYTYSNGRGSTNMGGADDDYFEESSMYQTAERSDGGKGLFKNSIAIPAKSPVREQANQLREENSRLQDESRQLNAQLDALNLEMDSMRRESEQRSRLVFDLEQKLEGLNGSLRDAIVAANPAANSNYRAPPYGTSGLEAGDMVGSHLDYMERGLAAITAELDSKQLENAGLSNAANASVERATRQADILHRQVRGLLATVNPTYPSLPEASSSSLDDKLDNIEDSLRVVDAETRQALQAAMSARSDGPDVEQMEATLRGLWDKIGSAFAEAKRQKEQRRRAGQADADELSDDDMVDYTEPYSLLSLSGRVQTLTSKAMKLREQKSVLQRQIKQQRELNSKQSTEGEAEMAKLQDEVYHTRKMLDTAETDLVAAQSKLAESLQELDALRRSQDESKAVAGRDADSLRDTRSKLVAAQANIEKITQEYEAKLAENKSAASELEANARDLKNKINEVEPEINELKRKLSQAESNAALLDDKVAKAVEARKTAEQELSGKQKELAAKLAETEVRDKTLKDKDDEIEKLNVMVIELKTELTISKAELDGAYGSRAERAAEVAAIKNSDDVVRLREEVDELKAQLKQTVDELEQITKETLGAERDKLELEGKLDDALATKSAMETEAQELRDKLDEEVSSSRALIAKLQEDLDNERLKVASGGGAGGAAGSRPGAGATMLSEQFRATMREERKRFQEDLKEEQARRRKVEEELTRLRRTAGARKSPLSPR